MRSSAICARENIPRTQHAPSKSEFSVHCGGTQQGEKNSQSVYLHKRDIVISERPTMYRKVNLGFCGGSFPGC